MPITEEDRVQDRLMDETHGLIDEAEVERAERKAAREQADEVEERLARLKTPIGVSPHEPPRRRRR